MRLSATNVTKTKKVADSQNGYAFNSIAGKGRMVFMSTLIMAILLHVLHNYIALKLRELPVLMLLLIVFDIMVFLYITSRVE